MAAAGRFLQPLLRTFSAQTRQLSAAAHGETHQAAHMEDPIVRGGSASGGGLHAQHLPEDAASLPRPAGVYRLPAPADSQQALPWGDGNHSLFHNSHVNALPTGYEGGEH